MRARAALAAGAALAAAAVLATVALTGCAPSGDGRTLKLSGDLAAHDPALVVDGDEQWVFSTGSTAGDGGIQIRRSDDGLDWRYAGEVWSRKPAWLEEAVPGVANLWAPEVIEHDGTWYLYYAASTFGSNRSVIGLATNTTLDPDDDGYEWVDRGEVTGSERTDDFNAIDAGVVVDDAGTPWMAFGSFWSGIRMVELEWPSGLRADPDAEPLRIADRGSPPNAIEAAYIVHRDGWYWLFVSKDLCCRGEDSTYSMSVGRSREVTGPYVDRDGRAMLDDGGTPLLGTDGTRIGPGGQSVSGDRLAFHWYDGTAGGAQTLAIAPLRWADGWPTVSWAG